MIDYMIWIPTKDDKFDDYFEDTKWKRHVVSIYMSNIHRLGHRPGQTGKRNIKKEILRIKNSVKNLKFEKQTLSAFYSLSLGFGAKMRETCFEVWDVLYNFVSDSKLVGGREEGEKWSWKEGKT